MAKFSNPSKLSKDEADQLIIQFCEALASLKNPAEAAKFVRDLISHQEAEMLAKRLKIAEMLFDGLKYSEIEKILKVCPITIARVAEWLKYSGEGYRLIIGRMSGNKKSFVIKKEKTPLEEMRRRYPMYYWPQIILEEIIKTANYRQQKKLKTVIASMNQKTGLYKQIKAAFKNTSK
jgi:TrpR-related protein YerC/YecD